jgi:hypothetical protein
MKKILLLVCMMFVGNVSANVISVGLDNVNPSVGETVTVSITLFDVVDDFSGFFIGFEFDTNHFEFVDGSVNSDFPLFDLLTGSGLDVDTTLAGDGNLFFNLFEDFFSPVVYGAADYLVASFELLTRDNGLTSVGLLDASLSAPSDPSDPSDPFAPIPAPITLDTSTSSVSVAVSSPATLGLFGMAALALFGFRRKT